MRAPPASPASQACAPPSRTNRCAQSGAHPAPSPRTSITPPCGVWIGGSRLSFALARYELGQPVAVQPEPAARRRRLGRRDWRRRRYRRRCQVRRGHRDRQWHDGPLTFVSLRLEPRLVAVDPRPGRYGDDFDSSDGLRSRRERPALTAGHQTATELDPRQPNTTADAACETGAGGGGGGGTTFCGAVVGGGLGLAVGVALDLFQVVAHDRVW